MPLKYLQFFFRISGGSIPGRIKRIFKNLWIHVYIIRVLYYYILFLLSYAKTKVCFCLFSVYFAIYIIWSNLPPGVI